MSRIGETIFAGTQNGAAAIQGDEAITLPDLPPPNVHGFAEYRGQLWVATEGGLAVYPGRGHGRGPGLARVLGQSSV